MKSTYKLFGTVWDGIEDNGQKIDINCYEKDMTAMISISALLGADSEDDIAKLLKPFLTSGTITLAMDYHPENENPVLKSFIEKRERQIKKYLMSKYDTVCCCYNTDKKVPSGATNA